MIISSAIKVVKDGVEFIIMGKRHHNCYETMYNAGVRRPFIDEQGFMTDTFEFVDRHKAFQIAKECNQFIEEPDFNNFLLSENIFK